MTYSYDKLYRLLGDGTRSYGYDPVGNRTNNTGTTCTYDHADRIQTCGATTYTVNDAGNLTVRGSDVFAYDQANRLTSATVGGATTTYAYDGDGMRATSTVGGTTTGYVYEADRSLLRRARRRGTEVRLRKVSVNAVAASVGRRATCAGVVHRSLLTRGHHGAAEITCRPSMPTKCRWLWVTNGIPA